MVALSRWQLQTLDGSQSYTFPINPNSQTSPLAQQVMAWYYGAPSANHGFVGQRQPRRPLDWQFSGVLLDQAEYDNLLSWCTRTDRLQLTTDLPEVLVIRIVDIRFARKAPQRPRQPWRHQYTVRAKVYSYGVPGTVNGAVATITTTAGAGSVTAATLLLLGPTATVVVTAIPGTPGETVPGATAAVTTTARAGTVAIS